MERPHKYKVRFNQKELTRLRYGKKLGVVMARFVKVGRAGLLAHWAVVMQATAEHSAAWHAGLATKTARAAP